MKKNRLKLIITVILITIVFLTIYIIDNYKKSQISKLNIYVAPSNAKILINNKEFENSAEHDIDPGIYEVEVSSDGYETEKYNLTIKPKSKESILLSLTKIDGSTSIEEDLVSSGVETRKYVEATEKMAEKYPILNKLPYRDTEPEQRFRILPQSSNSQLTGIEIVINDNCNSELYELYKRDALIKLNSIESEATKKYKILYTSSCIK